MHEYLLCYGLAMLKVKIILHAKEVKDGDQIYPLVSDTREHVTHPN